jgi:hypothetical protein
MAMISSELGCLDVAHAQSAIGSTDRALPGVIHVGAPVPAEAFLRVAGGAGYGWYEPFADIEASTHRMSGRIAASISPINELTLGLDIWGRFDTSSVDGGSETALYGEPRLTGRYALPIHDGLHVGAQADLRIVGAEAPSIKLDAITPALRAQIAARLAPQTWLAAELGFQLDNTENALDEDQPVSTLGNLTIGASSSSSIPWGVGVSHRLTGPKTELLGELSGDILVGADAPRFAESPLRLALGARHPLSEAFSLSGGLNFGLSARNEEALVGAYVPREPRISALVALGWEWGKKAGPVQEAPPPKAVEKKPPPPPPPVIKTSAVTGMVVDEGGRPLADVEVILTRQGSEPSTTRTYADGRFEFPEVPDEGNVELVIKTPGFENLKISYAEGEERSREVVLYPALPAGQVRGAVLDLSGKPIPASITITPGDHEVAVKEDGSFELELAPGRYTVRFNHPDYKNQMRVVVVEDRGVVILNIALSP